MQQDKQLVSIQIPPGEFFDRWSILRLKAERMTGTNKATAQENLRELEASAASWMRRLDIDAVLRERVQLLSSVNERLWEIENRIRDQDNVIFHPSGKFAEAGIEAERTYMQLARQVYLSNDERCRVKAEISELWGAASEPKQYAKYREAS